MKRLLVVCTALAAGWAAACGSGSGTITPPPPPPVGFTNASLKGTYVFSMTGTTEDPTTGSEDGFSRVGVFSADGSGNISTTGGIEDVHKFGSEQPFQITGGNYSISSDGRGTLSLITTGTSGTVQYSITLISATSGYLVDMISTGTETASGSFTLQTATTIATGTYIFDFSGIDPTSGNPISIVGDFIPTAAGSGSFASGSFEDINDGGNIVNKAEISGGNYQMDNANPGTGRGTANLGGLNYVFYVIDSQHIEMMGIDPDQVTGGTLLGEAVAQQAGTPNNLSAFNSSSFVFVIGGSDATGQPLTRAGRLTANSGNLTNILFDNNDGGTLTQVPLLTAGTVTLDGDNSGRGTFTFTDNVKNTGTYTFVFYLSSATAGVIQDVTTVTAGGFTSAVDVADGTLLAQTGAPFSSSSLAADYALSWSGASPLEEDFVGTFATAGANPNGVVDFNEFSALKEFTDTPFNGVFAIGGDGTGGGGQHSTFVATISGTPPVTINYFAYIANPNTILLMGTNANRVIAGILTAQNP
jgi:hypothetical protein